MKKIILPYLLFNLLLTSVAFGQTTNGYACDTGNGEASNSDCLAYDSNFPFCQKGGPVGPGLMGKCYDKQTFWKSSASSPSKSKPSLVSPCGSRGGIFSLFSNFASKRALQPSADEINSDQFEKPPKFRF